MVRPDRSDCDEYYLQYVGEVPDGDILEFLAGQRDEYVQRLRGLPAAIGDHRYAEGKWSVKEVLGHINDTERLFGFRALAFARGDTTPLPSFDQDEYVVRANFRDRSIADLADEFESHRTSLIVLFRSFDAGIWLRTGNACGFQFTTRAVPWILAGHLIHHAAVLEERYL